MANVGSSPYFQDFDEPSVYKDYEAAFLNPDTLNVVVEFDSAKAQAALNVEYIGMKEILDLKVREGLREPLRHKSLLCMPSSLHLC